MKLSLIRSHLSSFFTYWPVISSTTWIFTMGCEMRRSVLRRSVLCTCTPSTRLSSNTGFCGASASASVSSLTTKNRKEHPHYTRWTLKVFFFKNWHPFTMFCLLLFLFSLWFCFIFCINVLVGSFILVPGGAKWEILHQHVAINRSL